MKKCALPGSSAPLFDGEKYAVATTAWIKRGREKPYQEKEPLAPRKKAKTKTRLFFPIHLLEMLAHTHHMAWFRLCCVSHEFGVHSQRERVKLFAAKHFSHTDIAGYENRENMKLDKRDFTARGQDKDMFQMWEFPHLGFNKTTIIVSKVLLPSGVMHCIRQPAYAFVSSDRLFIEIVKWYYFGKKNAIGAIPAVTRYKTCFLHSCVSDKYWKMGERYNIPRFGHTISYSTEGLSVVSTYKTPTSDFVRQRGFLASREWIRDAHDMKKLTLKWEQYHHAYGGKNVLGRSETEGPAVIYYSENGTPIREAYFFGNQKGRVNGPATTFFFDDGAPMCSISFRKEEIVPLKGVWYSATLVLGDNRDFMAFISSDKIRRRNDKPSIVIKNRNNDHIAECRMNFYLFEYAVDQKTKALLPSFKYNNPNGTVCEFFHTGRPNHHNDDVLQGTETPASHRIRNCRCIPWLETAYAIRLSRLQYLSRDSLLEISRD